MAENQYIGVQFNDIGKVFTFSANPELELQTGMTVLVNTVRGRQLGKVVRLGLDKPEDLGEVQPVERIATEEDLAYKESLIEREVEALRSLRKFLRESNYEGVKGINAEYAFDGNRLILYLNYDNESGFDIKQFLREISRVYPNTRVDVRQVGPRDMAKAMSGLGACGIEKRCCSRFLKEFSSISIKMAKSQDISLTPAEITGICGRLRCCLIYEYDTYEEARKLLPKRKKVVATPLGEGKVVQVLPLAQAVVVDLPEGGPRRFTLEELESGVLAEKVVETQLISDHFESEDVEIVHLERRPERPERAERRDRPQRDGRTRDRRGTQPEAQNRPQSRRGRSQDRLEQRTQDQVGTRFNQGESPAGEGQRPPSGERRNPRRDQRSRSAGDRRQDGSNPNRPPTEMSNRPRRDRRDNRNRQKRDDGSTDSKPAG